MELRQDLCYELLYNVSDVEDEKIGFITKFMLSGKTPLLAVKKVVSETKNIIIYSRKVFRTYSRPEYSSYIVEFKVVS